MTTHLNQQPDVVIIGAGPAGSTAAALLCRQGFQVTVVEKSPVSPLCDR